MSTKQAAVQNNKAEPMMHSTEATVPEVEPRMPDPSFGESLGFHRQSEESLDAYAEKAIEQLIRTGQPVLASILACENPGLKTRALLVLRTTPGYSSIPLILTPRVTPPGRDYNGALVPANKRGKVLAAKVGLTSTNDIRAAQNIMMSKNKYGAIASKTNEKKAEAQYMSPYGRYAHVEIGFDKPTYLTFSDAVAVLSRYGYGVASDESFWFVQEV